MTAEIQEKVEHFMHLLSADNYRFGLEWNGYDVYEPVFYQHTCIGGPWFVLVNGNDVRFCTREEGLEYLNYKIALKNDSKKVG